MLPRLVRGEEQRRAFPFELIFGLSEEEEKEKGKMEEEEEDLTQTASSSVRPSDEPGCSASSSRPLGLSMAKQHDIHHRFINSIIMTLKSK